MLINQIKSDSLIARKARQTDTATLLTTLYSEASMIGKNAGNRESTDAEVLKVIEKFVKNANEVRNILLKQNKNVSHVDNEIEILSKYLPQKMSCEELEIAIKFIISGFGNKDKNRMGQVMAILKNNYNGNYDGKLASEIVRKELAD